MRLILIKKGLTYAKHFTPTKSNELAEHEEVRPIPYDSKIHVDD